MRGVNISSLLLVVVAVFATTMAAAPSAWSVRPDDETMDTLSEHDPYALGLKAFDAEEWQEVIRHMNEVVRKKPWHDNAYSLLGFAHRKLGDFDRSLSFYDRALTLNPHNREALEYLGEAYLELDEPERTEDVLAALALECERIAVTFPDGNWQTGCEEWVHLNAAYQAHLTGRPHPDRN